MTDKTIQEVKASWEKQLMAKSGVTGVGISLTKDHREKCIKVYMDRSEAALTGQIPKEIEGYPVEIEIRGTFKTLR